MCVRTHIYQTTRTCPLTATTDHPRHATGGHARRARRARRPVARDPDGLPRDEHRQRRAADAGAGVRRVVPGGAVGGPGLPAGDHHPDRQRRAAGRPHRPPPAADRGHRPLHDRLGPLRPRAHALDADRRARRAGARRGDHAGARHGLGQRDRSAGQDRERDGPARHDVGDRHRAGAIARRTADRRGSAGGRSSSSPSPWASSTGLLAYRHLPVDRRVPKTERAAFDHRGTLLLAADPRGLHAGDDGRRRTLRPAQPRAADGRRHRGRPVRARPGQDALAADPARACSAPRASAPASPRARSSPPS